MILEYHGPGIFDRGFRSTLYTKPRAATATAARSRWWYCWPRGPISVKGDIVYESIVTLSCVMKRMSKKNMLGVTNSMSCLIVPHQSMSLTVDISAAPVLTDQATGELPSSKGPTSHRMDAGALGIIMEVLISVIPQ